MIPPTSDKRSTAWEVSILVWSRTALITSVTVERGPLGAEVGLGIRPAHHIDQKAERLARHDHLEDGRGARRRSPREVGVLDAVIPDPTVGDHVAAIEEWARLGDEVLLPIEDTDSNGARILWKEKDNQSTSRAATSTGLLGTN